MRDEQLKKLGTSYDWEREITPVIPTTIDWTQWIFLQFYKVWISNAKEAACQLVPGMPDGSG